MTDTLTAGDLTRKLSALPYPAPGPGEETICIWHRDGKEVEFPEHAPPTADGWRYVRTETRRREGEAK